LLKIYRPDDVDDCKFSQIGVQNGETTDLFAVQLQINFEISVFPAPDTYQTRPAWATKLCSNRFSISSRDLPVSIEFKTLDIDAFDSDQQGFDLFLVAFIFEYFCRESYQSLVDADV